MKSKEELEALKKELEAVSEKCRELTPEELAQVSGGRGPFIGGLRDFESDTILIGPHSFVKAPL